MNTDQVAVHSTTLGTHAIMIGESLARLFAARVLSEYVAQVTVLERDDFAAPEQYRKGVPQARHSRPHRRACLLVQHQH